MLGESEETVLLGRAQHAGDHRAMAMLVRSHRPRILRLLLRLTRGDRQLSEDLTQETFYRAVRALPRFEGRCRFGTWLHRIAYFAYLNHRDRAPRHARLSAEYEEQIPSTLGCWNTGQADLQWDLEFALAELPEAYRDVVLLHLLDNLAYQDIATTLALPLGTVKTRLHRAKRLMREVIDPVQGGERRGSANQTTPSIPPSNSAPPTRNKASVASPSARETFATAAPRGTPPRPSPA